MPESTTHHLKSRIENGVLVLSLTCRELRDDDLTAAVGWELIAAFDASGASKVVLDLAEVTYVASLGLSALLAFRRHLREHGGRLLLCNPTPLVADVLFTTHLAGPESSATRPFALAADVASAVAALGEKARPAGQDPQTP